MIPKIIHILWAQGENDAPDVVKFAIRMWRVLNPEFEVNVYSQADLDAVIGDDVVPNVLSSMKIQFQSDLLRTKLLSTRGGIWVDASCIPNVPASNWIGRHGSYDFAAPHFNKPGRTISNWFMVSRENGYIMRAQYERLLKYWKTPKHVLPRDPVAIAEIEKNWRLFISDEFAHILRVAPYFLWHYNFTILLEEDGKALRLFNASPEIIKHNESSFVNSFGVAALEDPEKDRGKLFNFIRTTGCVLNKVNWRNRYSYPFDDIEGIILERAGLLK